MYVGYHNFSVHAYTSCVSQIYSYNRHLYMKDFHMIAANLNFVSDRVFYTNISQLSSGHFPTFPF